MGKQYEPTRDKERYEMYIFDISYFSGKLEAYFKYKEIPYKRIEVSWWELASKIVQKTGLMEVPVVHDVKNDIWLSDTTPLIEYFENHIDNQSLNCIPILPSCPIQQFFSFLIGDFADEGLWRPAIYYRWSKTVDRAHYGWRFTKEFYHNPFLPGFLKRRLIANRMMQGYVRKDGIRDENTRNHTEKLYLETLHILEKHFQKHNFILGNSPTFLDFCLFASMFRHFSLDPTPAKIMRQEGPSVFEWVARMWNAKESSFCEKSLASPPGSIPESWKELLPFVKEYLVYLHENSNADKSGKKTFTYTVDNVTYRNVEVVPYRSWRREVLINRFESLSNNDKLKIESILKEYDCWNDFISDKYETNYFKDKPSPPFTKGKKEQSSFLMKSLLYITGTPRHQNSLFASPLLISLLIILLTFIFGLIYFVYQILF